MKTLYLVRHAKSSWEFDLDDHDRPLNDRGLRDASKVSAHIANELPKPDLMLSSTALRAKTTAFFFAKAYGISEDEVQLNKTLYDFSGLKVVEVIKSCHNSVNYLMVFGHNNSMTTIVNAYGDLVINNVPTCGFTAISFDIDNWMDLNLGKTTYTCTPKRLNL